MQIFKQAINTVASSWKQ